MKCTEHSILTHYNKHYFHFWLIPSIEIDYENFTGKHVGDFKWTNIYFRWLFWSINIEFEEV